MECSCFLLGRRGTELEGRFLLEQSAVFSEWKSNSSGVVLWGKNDIMVHVR